MPIPETKFSRGPWVKESTSCEDDIGIFAGPKGLEVEIVVIVHPMHSGLSWEETEANADLTAAAPDLYAALCDLEIWWSNWMPDDAGTQGGYVAQDAARAALAKARGEASRG